MQTRTQACAIFRGATTIQPLKAFRTLSNPEQTPADTDPQAGSAVAQTPTSEKAAAGGKRVAGWHRWMGEFSGAFADLGTFLPLIIGIFAVQQLDPTGVLLGFGLFALATAVIYRRPVPVQPMKVVAAVVIAGGLGASEVAATGLLLGIVLCVFWDQAIEFFQLLQQLS